MLLVVRDGKRWLDCDISSWTKGDWVPRAAGSACGGGGGGEVNCDSPLGSSDVIVGIWGISVLTGGFLKGGDWERCKVRVQSRGK